MMIHHVALHEFGHTMKLGYITQLGKITMNQDCSSKTSLSACALGMALGISWGLGVMLLALMSWLGGGWGNALVTALGSLYVGYQATGVGSLIGLVWGFADGFISGLIIAWIYNFVLCHCRCKNCCPGKKA